MPLKEVPSVEISPRRPEGYVNYIHKVADLFRERLPFEGRADVLLTLGSGLDPIADGIEFQPGKRIEIKDSDIGLPVGELEGHNNSIIAGVTTTGKNVIIKRGRVHPYQVNPLGVDVEGYGRFTPEQVGTAYLRVMDEIGVKNVILTCAAGGIQHPTRPGDKPVFNTFPTVAIIESDIDFRYGSPLQGGHLGLGRGDRFVNWRESDSILKDMFTNSMKSFHGADINVPRLVYGTSMSSPLFENRAIIHFLAKNGVKLVGMSISPEIQVISDAKNMDNLLALAIVTNPQTLKPVRGNQAIIDIRELYNIPLSPYELQVIAEGGELIPSQFDLQFIDTDDLMKEPASHAEVVAAGEQTPAILAPPLMQLINSL